MANKRNMRQAILWQTKGIWDNGKERTLTGHHQFDPYDPTFETAAGDERKWHIDGKGKCTANGPRTRGYQHTKQQAGIKYIWDDQYIHNSSLKNFSKQFFSKHNEEPQSDKET